MKARFHVTVVRGVGAVAATATTILFVPVFRTGRVYEEDFMSNHRFANRTVAGQVAAIARDWLVIRLPDRGSVSASAALPNPSPGVVA